MANLRADALPHQQTKENIVPSFLPITWIIFGHAVLDVYANLIPPIMHLLALAMGLKRAEIGIIYAALQISGSGLQPVCGFFVDRWGKMWLLPASIVFTGIFAAAVGFTTSFAALLAAAILLGLGSAVYHPLGSVAVNKLGGDMKGFAISLFFCRRSFWLCAGSCYWGDSGWHCRLSRFGLSCAPCFGSGTIAISTEKHPGAGYAGNK
jgi:MFS family permease